MLQFSVFVLLMLSVLFLFNACNKESLIDEESIEYRADYSDLTGQNLEFYNWFNQMLTTHDYNNPDSIVSPFYFNIDWHSGSHFQYFGDNTLVYNVINGDDEISLYSRIQVMITKKPDNNYLAKMLFYRADSTYYEKNFIYPSLYNFTGAVFEVTKFQSGIDNIYILQYGDLVKTITNAEIRQKNGDKFQLRGPRFPWVTCDGKFHFRDFFGWVSDVVGGGLKDFGDWLSNMFDDFGDWWGSWQGGGGSGVGGGWSYGGGSNGGYFGGFGNFGGSGGRGGSSSGTGGSNPWDKPLNKANYDCAVENYKYLQENHPEFLNELNFWVPCSGMDYTLSALQYLCSKTNNNPSASNDEIWQKFMDKWRKIRAESISDALECQNCAFAFEKFEDKYDITLTEDQKKDILKNMSTCTRQSEFECLTNKALFFKRADVIEMMSDTEPLDPCSSNPDETSFNSLLNEYACSNCSSNLMNVPTSEILNSIIDKLMGPKLDWLTATNDEKAYRILKGIRLANRLKFCFGNPHVDIDGVKPGEISLIKMFDNLPSSNAWDQTSQWVDACFGYNPNSQTVQNLQVGIFIDFEVNKNKNCLNSQPSNQFHGGANPNNYYYDFWNCNPANLDTAAGMTIQFGKSHDDAFTKYLMINYSPDCN